MGSILDEDQVIEVENLLLQCRFRTALRKATKILQSIESSSIPTAARQDNNASYNGCRSSSCTVVSIQVPVNLSNGCGYETRRYFHIHLKGREEKESEDDGANKNDNAAAVDRVAAIVIQSVYEIWKATTTTTTGIKGASTPNPSHSGNDGPKFFFLRPFVDLYSSTTTKNGYSASDGDGSGCGRVIMDSSLAFLLIEFLQATGDYGSAMELSGELLHSYIVHNDISVADKCSFCNRGPIINALATMLFTKILPRASEKSHVEEFLRRLDEPRWTRNRVDFRASADFDKESVETILSFLGEKACQRLVWNGVSTVVLNQCQSDLRHALSQLENKEDKSLQHTLTQKQNDPQLELRNTTTTAPAILQYVLEFYGKILQRVQFIKRYGTNSKQQTVLALSMLLVVIVWRRKRVLIRHSKTAIMFLVKPIHEIVKALIPD